MQKGECTTKQHISRADILLIIFFIAAAVLLQVWMLFGRREGSKLQISYDGTELYTISLEQSADAETQKFCLITYAETPEGKVSPAVSFSAAMPACPADSSYNLLVIEEGTVTMEAADCRDQICVHHIPISGSGESIICLPHKLVVTVNGKQDDDNALDGVAK
jgi:hypothetical protein